MCSGVSWCSPPIPLLAVSTYHSCFTISFYRTSAVCNTVWCLIILDIAKRLDIQFLQLQQGLWHFICHCEESPLVNIRSLMCLLTSPASAINYHKPIVEQFHIFPYQFLQASSLNPDYIKRIILRTLLKARHVRTLLCHTTKINFLLVIF